MLLGLVLVAGESCPAAVDVEPRVRIILHLSAEQELSERIRVERREGELYVGLRSADSMLIGERVLPAEGSCDELAEAAAVVLSAWLTDVHPDFAGALPAAPPEPPEPEPPAPERAAPEPKAAIPAPVAHEPPSPAPMLRARVPRIARRAAYGADLVMAVGVGVAGRRSSAAGLLSAGWSEAQWLGLERVGVRGYGPP